MICHGGTRWIDVFVLLLCVYWYVAMATDRQTLFRKFVSSEEAHPCDSQTKPNEKCRNSVIPFARLNRVARTVVFQSKE